MCQAGIATQQKNCLIVDPISKRPLLPDICVPDEQDLRFASTGSDFNPRNTTCIYPKGIYYAAPAVNPPSLA